MNYFTIYKHTTFPKGSRITSTLWGNCPLVKRRRHPLQLYKYKYNIYIPSYIYVYLPIQLLTNQALNINVYTNIRSVILVYLQYIQVFSLKSMSSVASGIRLIDNIMFLTHICISLTFILLFCLAQRCPRRSFLGDLSFSRDFYINIIHMQIYTFRYIGCSQTDQTVLLKSLFF